MRLSPFQLLDGRFAPVPEHARVAWLIERLYAHRGYHGEGRLENSPSAFRAALAAGIGIECDVQQSAEGQAMVFHDWELDRLTGIAGLVREQPAATLVHLRLGESEDTIWPLSKLLEVVGGEVPLLIELKSRREVPFVPLCLAVRQALLRYQGPVAVMSFDPRAVRWFARNAPAVVRGLVASEQGQSGLKGRWRRHAALWQARPDFLAYDVRDLPSRFAFSQQERGVPVLTWTVSDRPRLQRGRAHAQGLIAEGVGLQLALATH
ncbi:MAG: glycerophosphodiester phosphodiesterase family protein [Croceibacterium sp.]